MSQRSRSALVLVGLAAAGFGLCVGPGPARIGEWLGAGPPGGLQALAAGGARDEESKIVEIDRTIAIKNQLAAELVAGDRTLGEVTDDFLLLLRNREAELAALRCLYDGASDREKVARSVVRFAGRQPGASDDALARLDAAFLALFPRAAPPAGTGHEPPDRHQAAHVAAARRPGSVLIQSCQ